MRVAVSGIVVSRSDANEDARGIGEKFSVPAKSALPWSSRLCELKLETSATLVDDPRVLGESLVCSTSCVE